MSIARPVEYREGYFPGSIGMIAELHGIYYADHWGAGSLFEIMMARELCDFVEGYRQGSDLLLTAATAGSNATERAGRGKVAGSIVIIGPHNDSQNGWAQLRWFLLDPGMHGQGIGTELLDRALRFVRERFNGCFLWTVTGLPASMHMYEKRGFVPVTYEVDNRYGVKLTSVRMELDLTP